MTSTLRTIGAALRSLVTRSAFTSAFLRGEDLPLAAGKLLRPYEQSAWIQRAITLKANELKQAPLKFYDGDVEYEDGRFADWWARPFLGPGQRRLSAAEGIEQLAAWLDLEGEYFLVLGDDWLVPFRRGALPGLPVIVRPHRMRHVVRGGEIIGWIMTDGAGRQHELLPEQVVHRALFNPYDDFRGLAPVNAVLNAAEADYLAGLYVRNLMRNNGDQGVYVIAKDGQVDDQQQQQITEVLRAKRAARLRGDFRPVFLTGNITVEDAKAQAPDANLQATRLQSRHEIFIGLGVPASMADIKAAYSIGSASDRYQLITGTCMALGRTICEPLGDLASRQSNRVLTAELDWDNHPVLAEARRERLDAADKLWQKGMPMRAVNDYLDLGMQPYRGWDVGYLPFSVVPVSDGGEIAPDSDPATDPALSETPVEETDEVKAVRLALALRQRARQRTCQRVEREPDGLAAFRCSCGASDEELVEMKDRDSREVARWRDYMAKRRAVLRGFENRFTRELMVARRETLARIEATPDLKAVTKAAAVDLVFSLEKWREGFLATMRKQMLVGLDAAGAQLYEELERDDPFRFPPGEVLDYQRQRENKLAGVADSTHERIKEAIEEGLMAGDTRDQLARRVRETFNGISAERARTIAATETAAVYGTGRQVAMRTAGVQWKRWLTSGNSNVRTAHAAANGQTVPVTEPFLVGGEELMHPGDESGSPENVINCHCVSIPVASEEAP